MTRTRQLVTSAAAAALAVGMVVAPGGPAGAAATVTHGAACSTPDGQSALSSQIKVSDDATRYGTLRTVTTVFEGAFADEPTVTIRIRDGYGVVKVTRRQVQSGDSSFALKVAGPNWTADVTLGNALEGTCTSPRVKIRA